MTDTAHPAHGFHVLTKPIGPICNLDCKYCFYLEKEKLYPGEQQWRMSDEVLETYIRQYIQDQPGPEINFAWQGGEPTLLGVDFFRKVVELQKKVFRMAKLLPTRSRPMVRCSMMHGANFWRRINFWSGFRLMGRANCMIATAWTKAGSRLLIMSCADWNC